MTPQTSGNRTGLYFEVAPFDWSDPAGPPFVAWCEGPGATQRTFTRKSIGSGQRNSRKIAKLCTSSAAQLALAYSAKGRADWFLPSSGELSSLQTQAQKTGLGGSWIGTGDTQNPVDWYWSSSGGQICANYTSLSETKKPCKRPKPGSIVVHIKGSEGKVRAPKSDVYPRYGSNLVRPVRSFPR